MRPSFHPSLHAWTKTAEMMRMDGAVPFDEAATPWRAWSPRDATTRLTHLRTSSGRPPRWAVAGGWAIDLHLGRVTRQHDDLEIVLLDEDVPAVLSAFSEPEWQWTVPTDGWLHPLASTAFTETHQTWLWSHETQAFVLDVFRDSHDGNTWICRRDTTIRRPWREVVGISSDGSPYLAPEVVLLFKAKHARAKDAADLKAVLPALDEPQRRWLSTTLQQVHPGHPWLEPLQQARPSPTDSRPR